MQVAKYNMDVLVNSGYLNLDVAGRGESNYGYIGDEHEMKIGEWWLDYISAEFWNTRSWNGRDDAVKRCVSICFPLTCGLVQAGLQHSRM